MITTRAVPVPLSHHHRRVTQIPAALTNDFADPLLQNVSSQYDTSYYWHSGPSSGGGALTAGSGPWCMVRSFVGLPISVSNLSARAPIRVTFPIGR